MLIDIYFRYNSILDLERIAFEEVRETYSGSDYQYVIGTIRLQTLIREQNHISKHGLFIVLVNDHLRDAGQNVQAPKQKQTINQ